MFHPAPGRVRFVNAGVWEKLYQSLQVPRMDPVITGFNAGIDRVIPVTPDILRSFEQLDVQGSGAIRDRLEQSMRHCSADEVFISDPSVYARLSEPFSRSGILSVGGQAGIAAVHLHRLGIPSVTCAVPGAGPETCTLLQDAGVVPLTFGPGTNDRPDRIHLVFEYAPGLVPLADHVVPRSNRFIVSPVHDPSTVIIPGDSVDSFLERITLCRRAFLSGYQYLRTEQEFVTAARQIRMIRSVHPLMRTHVECVSGADRNGMAMMLRHILPNANSIGLNEGELGLYLHAVRAPDPGSVVREPVSPVACVRNAIALADATGVSRLHLHTFGYYMLVLKSGTPDPECSRNALLLAARVTAGAAGGDDRILSREGLLAYAALRRVFGPDESPGIFRHAGWIVVLVPTCISQNIQKTSGLGDILSSTAFVADRF
jgi:ADP-dependent phosphofructokinase/glucokinase